MLVLTTLCHLHPIPDIISSKGARRPSETAIFWISDFRTILANWSLIMIWCTAVMEWVSDAMTKNFPRTWIQYAFSSRPSMVHTGLRGDHFFSENNKVDKESVTRWYLTYGSATRVSYFDLSSKKMWEFLIFELRWQMIRPKPSYPMIEWFHDCLSFPLRKRVASVMVYEMFVNFSGSSKIQSWVQVSSRPIHIPFIRFEDRSLTDPIATTVTGTSRRKASSWSNHGQCRIDILWSTRWMGTDVAPLIPLCPRCQVPRQGCKELMSRNFNHNV